MKLNVFILLFPFLTFSSSAIVHSSSSEVSHESSTITKVLKNKDLRNYLFDMIDIDASIRLVSKDFKKEHDLYCGDYLFKMDWRLRNYLGDIQSIINDDVDDDYNFVPSLMSPTLRLEVPLYYLFSKYLRPYSSNIVDIIGGRIFISMAMLEFSRKYKYFRTAENPKYILYFYILVQNCFYSCELDQICFPTFDLIVGAAKGLFPDPYNEEIICNLNTKYIPSLAFDALESGRVDLARIILNKPNVSKNLGRYIDFKYKMNVLHLCAEMGVVDLIDRCLELEADPFIIDRKSQYRPIHYAVDNGHLEIVKKLFIIDKGAHITTSNTTLSPFLLAINKGRADIVEFFLSQPEVNLIGDPYLCESIAQMTLDADDSRIAQILLNSGKLELPDGIYNNLQLLASRID